MNDRFRFRVWGISHKKFENKKTVEDAKIGFLPKVSSNYIVEQCTGLKDKNGRLIYEGDIVCWTRAQTDRDVDNICPIVFDKDMCSFGPLLNGNSLWMPHQTDLRMKVIGNIHETPELLEDK